MADALAGLHFAPFIPAAEIFGADRSGWAVELAYAVDGGPDAVAARLSHTSLARSSVDVPGQALLDLPVGSAQVRLGLKGR
jgi:hypothetical protein